MPRARNKLYHSSNAAKPAQAVRNIAELLGHEGLAMSRRYAHLSISNLHEAVSRIAISTPVAPEPLHEPNANSYFN